MADTAHYRAELRRVIEGRPWIVAKDVLAGAVAPLAQLEALGAERLMVIAGYRGAGPIPDPQRVPTVLLDLPPGEMMAAIHGADAALSDLPPAARAAVERFDPERRARVLAALFSSGRPVADRPVWGARPAAWQALEDKTVIDAVWDEVGVPRAPSAVVPAALEALRGAAAALDRGRGTVWAADMREGFNGCASGLRWVRDPGGEQGREVAALRPSGIHRPRIGRRCGPWPGGWATTCAGRWATGGCSPWTG